MRIVYWSNNSGGRWWLSDDDWHALEAAGWTVNWAKDDPYKIKWGSVNASGRYMGALATSASVDRPSRREAIAEWERITGQNSRDPGCSCCGQPHEFYEGDEDE